MSKHHNVFVSHRHEDDALIDDLRGLLQRHGVTMHDSSVNSSTPNDATADGYIRSLLAARIRWAGTIIVLVSRATREHEWVDWEIEYANKHPGKRIIGVWAPGADGCDLPEPLERYADAVVAWRGEAILDALNGADNWEQPDGEPRDARPIKRIAC